MKAIRTHLLSHTVKGRVQILAETAGYNIRLMNVPQMWTETEGEGVKVVVLDTGAPEHIDVELSGSKSFAPDSPAPDRNGHASHVSGIIRATRNNGIGVVGIAPKCELYAGKVLNDDGSGELQWVIDGIMWAVDEIGADIINLSLGLPAWVPIIDEFEGSCRYAHNMGTTIIAAAGNESGRVGQPANYDTVITTAAVDDKQQHAHFSNTGRDVDFATGGVAVYSTYLNNGYAKLSGTSMSSPALTGAAALILAKHRKAGQIMQPDDVYEHIQRVAYDVGPEGYDDLYGHGIPLFGHRNTELEAKPPETAWWQNIIKLIPSLP
jgi:subtilisin family serine protease